MPGAMDARRARLEIRSLVIGWRDVIGDVRAGRIPDSRESIQRMTTWALVELKRVEGSLVASRTDAAQIRELLREARSELQGASFHDLSDSREEAG